MTFKVGIGENGFDPDISGEWFFCEYKFDLRTSDTEIRDFYMPEQEVCCKTASAILDMIDYNSLFAYDETNTALTLLVEREWAFQKYCLILDVLIPILFKHESEKPFIPNSVMEQKVKLEALLNTTMEVVGDKDSKLVFNQGQFLQKEEDLNATYNDPKIRNL